MVTFLAAVTLQEQRITRAALAIVAADLALEAVVLSVVATGAASAVLPGALLFADRQRVVPVAVDLVAGGAAVVRPHESCLAVHALRSIQAYLTSSSARGYNALTVDLVIT